MPRSRKPCRAKHPQEPGVRCTDHRNGRHYSQKLKRRASKNHNAVRAHYSWE